MGQIPRSNIFLVYNIDMFVVIITSFVINILPQGSVNIPRIPN